MFQKLKAAYFPKKSIAMSNFQIFKSVQEFKKFRSQITTSVGFVPTMGALHAGHASLFQKANSENEFSVVSIYINPTQFNNSTDFEKYPKTLDADINLAKDCGLSAVFLPEYSEIYADQYRYKVSENTFSEQLCGLHRPGHFDGVLTVVMKLLNIVQPNKAYFGKKDYQQFQLIQDMVQSFFMQTEIIGVETVREKSGLAMSSRNLRLSVDGLKKAAMIYQMLKSENNTSTIKNQLTINGFDVDYVEDILNRRYAAASLEGVRLIDNVEI
jgi:pantoate--beta-alanine ligase